MAKHRRDDDHILRIDMELLHLAVELAATQATRLEVTRQFSEQHPDLSLTLQPNVDFAYFDNVAINIPGWTVEYVNADDRTRIA